MKDIFKIFTLIFSLLIVVSCGDEDLEPSLALSKDTSSAINNDDDLFNVMASAYNRMTPSSYYGRDVIIMGDVRTDNMYSTMALVDFKTPTWITILTDMDHGLQFTE